MNPVMIGYMYFLEINIQPKYHAWRQVYMI